MCEMQFFLRYDWIIFRIDVFDWLRAARLVFSMPLLANIAFLEVQRGGEGRRERRFEFCALRRWTVWTLLNQTFRYSLSTEFTGLHPRAAWSDHFSMFESLRDSRIWDCGMRWKFLTKLTSSQICYFFEETVAPCIQVLRISNMFEIF